MYEQQQEQLTPRELEVLELLFNPELERSDIAALLHITKHTLKNHTWNIYTKLGALTRFEAVCKYARINPEYRQAFITFLSKDLGIEE